MSTRGRAFAEKYVGLVNAGKYTQLATLFAPNAVFLGPAERELHGHEEISTFYAGFLSNITPQVRLASLLEAGDTCVYELEALLEGDAGYRLGAIDHVTLDPSGLATRFAVYTK